MPSRNLPDLESVLLTDRDAGAMQAHGTTEAAVLIAVAGWATSPRITFTERRADLRKHAGEISFPGGRRDETDPDLTHTALREAEEEISLPRAQVKVVGALPPVGTFVTSYRIQPFVGLIPEDVDLVPDPGEVASILGFKLDQLAEAYAMRRLVRHGIPFRTPTFEVGRHLIWGATARILTEFLDRLGLLD